MSYSKKNHKYIRKYFKNGKTIYVYPNDRNYVNVYTLGTTGDTIAGAKTYRVKHDVRNTITGYRYKQAASEAAQAARDWDPSKMMDSEKKVYGELHKTRYRQNLNAASVALSAYRDATIAGALGKLKNKAKFTALKLQRKVSKAIKKLTK